MHSLSDHGHKHVYLHASHAANERRTRAVVALTLVVMVAEIVAGQLTGSMALLADGVHMATHAGALGLAAIAYAFARRHADSRRFAFGTGKIGDLAGFASALLLGLGAIGIAAESVMRMIEPGRVAFDEAMLVALLGLVANILSALLLAPDHGHGDGDDHGHAHDHHRDNNLRSAYLHVLADALTSVLAIAALAGGRWLGWLWLDPAVGLLGAVVIARWSIGLIRDTAAVLVDASEPMLAEAVRARIESDSDARVTDLHVWRLGPGAHGAIIALVAGKPRETGHYKALLEPIESLAHVTVEIHRCGEGHD